MRVSKKIEAIEAIEAIPVSVPIEAPILTCYGSLAAYSRTILRLVTESGTEGYGELAGRYRPEMIQRFAPILKGANPWDTTYLRHRIKHWNYYPYEKPEPLMAAVEMACLDILGKSVGEPVYRLLGGKVHESVPVAGYLFYRHENAQGQGQIHSVDQMMGFAKDQVAQFGYKALKLKGGYFSPQIDRDTLEALRETFGRDMALRIDPQGAWTPATAIRIGQDVDRLGLEYYEDPCWNAAAMAQVRDRVRTPLASNMCVNQFEDFHAARTIGAIDVVLADPWYWGGMRACLEVDRLCHTTGIDLGMHSGAELGIGWAALIQCAVAMPHLKLAIDNMNLHLVEDIIEGGKMVPKDGMIAPPDAPGLGVTIDVAKLDKFRQAAQHSGSADRLTNPDLADQARPGWYPTMPAW